MNLLCVAGSIDYRGIGIVVFERFADTDTQSVMEIVNIYFVVVVPENANCTMRSVEGIHSLEFSLFNEKIFLPFFSFAYSIKVR